MFVMHRENLFPRCCGT